MGSFRVLLVVVVMAVCVDLLAYSVQASARNKTRRAGGRMRRRQPLWLREATGKGNVLLKADLVNVVFQNKRIINALKELTPLVANLSDRNLVKNCSLLFTTPVHYTEGNSAKGQTDVILRMKAFHSLLKASVKNCQELEGRVLEKVQDASDAVQVYLSKLTATCERHLSSARSSSPQAPTCGRPNEGSDNQYSCQSQVCSRDNANTSRERVLILSRQLECFLRRLKSSKPILCTGQGPKRLRKGKNKNRKRNKNKGDKVTQQNRPKKKKGAHLKGTKGKKKKNRKYKRRVGKGRRKRRRNGRKKNSGKQRKSKKTSRGSPGETTMIPTTD